MTVKELSQLFWLNEEITVLQSRIYEIETTATSTTQNITGLPGGGGVSDKVGNLATEIAELKTELEAKQAECARELRRLTRYINDILDSEIRIIMTLRYITGLTWREVAKSVGHNDEQYPRHKHNRYLRNEKARGII